MKKIILGIIATLIFVTPISVFAVEDSNNFINIEETSMETATDTPLEVTINAPSEITTETPSEIVKNVPSENMDEQTSDVEIESDNNQELIDNNSYGIFENPLNKLAAVSNSRFCQPGFPGYPNCKKDPIVSRKYVTVSTSYRWVNSGNLITSVYGGKYGATMSINSSVSVSVEGVGFSTGQGASFKVPKGKTGNIVLSGYVKYERKRLVVTHRSGKKSYGGTITKKSSTGKSRLTAVYY